MGESVDAQYMALIRRCLVGDKVTTRNATCYRTFGEKVVLDSTPLVGVRKTAWKNALREFEWFMSGSSCIWNLHPSVRHWWSEWADPKTGEIPHNYSKQFRRFMAVDPECGKWVVFDQINYLLESITNHPNGRRTVATTWNPYEMAHPSCPITNCHGSLIQCIVDSRNRLHMKMDQRSADVVCGLSHNWIQYWAFLRWLAHRTGRTPGTLTWIGGDVHVYEQHLPVVREMESAGLPGETPVLCYSPSGDEFQADDFYLDRGYKPLVTTRAVMVV